MAKIHKLTKNGQTICPATTTDAVVHPGLKVPSSKLIEEINISKLFPTEGIDGGNKYTLETAIAKIPASLRTIGLKCSFLNEDSKPETWEYKGWNFLEFTSWEQIGSTKITEMHTILESINPVVQEIMEGPMLNQLNTPADDSNCFYNIRKNKNEARSDSLYNYSFINVKPGEVFQGSARIGGGTTALFTF